MKNKVEYLVDLQKLDRFESIAFQKAYDKVKKDVRIFEAELRSKIASEIKKETLDKIKNQLTKDITVRLEKHYKEEHSKKMVELDHLIHETRMEKDYVLSLLEHVRENVKRKYNKFPIHKHQVVEAVKYRFAHPETTIRKLHQKFVPEVALSTFHEYLKKYDMVQSAEDLALFRLGE